MLDTVDNSLDCCDSLLAAVLASVNSGAGVEGRTLSLSLSRNFFHFTKSKDGLVSADLSLTSPSSHYSLSHPSDNTLIVHPSTRNYRIHSALETRLLLLAFIGT